jgi:hypothetical protein
MACLFDTKVENCGPGSYMLVEKIGWCTKIETENHLVLKNECFRIEETKSIPYNAIIEETWQLVYIPPETKVISGYGWGKR